MFGMNGLVELFKFIVKVVVIIGMVIGVLLFFEDEVFYFDMEFYLGNIFYVFDMFKWVFFILVCGMIFIVFIDVFY